MAHELREDGTLGFAVGPDACDGFQSRSGADPNRLAALKYNLLTATEGCLGVARHLCPSEGWGGPRTTPTADRVLSPALAGSLSAAARFRSLLVHEYAQIDDERVAGYPEHLGEFEAFVAAFAAWMGR